MPRAASRKGAIFSGESLLQERKSALLLNVNFRLKISLVRKFASPRLPPGPPGMCLRLETSGWLLGYSSRHFEHISPKMFLDLAVHVF